MDSSHQTCEFFIVAQVDQDWDFGVMGYASSPAEAVEKARAQFDHLRAAELKIAMAVQVQIYEPPLKQ